jgi:hypothetical protein
VTFKGREARTPAGPVARRGLSGEVVVPGAPVRVAFRNVPGRRQIPRFGVAVALVANPHGAVDVRHDRHRTGVGAGRGLEGRSHVTTRSAARRVGPVQRRVDGQQVRQEVAARVLEVVDPLHAHRPVPLRLDRQRGGVVNQQAPLACGLDRPVAPYGRRRQARRQDLLRDLAHRDLVVVRVLAATKRDRPGLRHDRRDEQRRLEPGHGQRVERAPRDGSREHPRHAVAVVEKQPHSGRAPDLDEVSPLRHGLPPCSRPPVSSPGPGPQPTSRPSPASRAICQASANGRA